MEKATMEKARVEAVTHRDACSIVIAEGTAGGRGEARGILEAVTSAFPELELVAHEQATDAHGAIVWLGSREDAVALQSRFKELRGPGGEWKLGVEHDAGFVSLVGYGLGAAEAAKAEQVLERAGIPIVALRTMPTALVFRIAGKRTEEATRALHAAFLE